MRNIQHGRFIANPPRLARCVDEMEGLSEEVQGMFREFQNGVSAFTPWAGDGTERTSQQFQLGWRQQNESVDEIGLPLQQSVVGLTSATRANLRTIESTQESAHDQVRDHRSRTEALMDDDSDSGYGSDSRH
ncbi:hypothetical protein [Streptomyces sp. NPDC002156]